MPTVLLQMDVPKDLEDTDLEGNQEDVRVQVPCEALGETVTRGLSHKRFISTVYHLFLQQAALNSKMDPAGTWHPKVWEYIQKKRMSEITSVRTCIRHIGISQ